MPRSLTAISILKLSLVCGIFFLWISPAQAKEKISYQQVKYSVGDIVLKGHLCKPSGEGPFPAVIYNHGGFGGKLPAPGPKENCEALVEEGFVGFSPLRRETIDMEEHMEDVLAAVDFVLNLKYVDKDRMGIMGFSRGGHLAFRVAAQRPIFKAVIVMASAPGRGNLQKYLDQAQWITAPVLLMVAKNDTKPNDHVLLSQQLKESLEYYGKDVQLIIYPPFEESGHLMFSHIDLYWQDVKAFLREKL